jgi:hypothetical protein
MRSALLVVVVFVTVAPRSPPSPIPSIRPTRTPDTPVDVFIVAAVVDVALSPSACRWSRPAERSLSVS